MFGLFDGTPLERPVLCDGCGKTADECECSPIVTETTIAPEKQNLRVRRERRRGKECTVVSNIDPTNVKPLLKRLRAELGVGGGESDGDLVLQGDHRDQVVARLEELGYQAKPAGG